MRFVKFIEEFIAVSIALIGRAIIQLMMWICVVSLFAAGLSLLIRGIYWLRFGDWISSICDGNVKLISNNVPPFENSSPFLCIDSDIGWNGVDKLLTWFFSKGDASLSLLIIGLITISLLFLSVKIIDIIPSDVKKYYASMKYFQVPDI